MGRIVNNAIPNLINGVSQQPETLRLSSQATDQENGYSSVVEGLRKRPPTEFVKKIRAGIEFYEDFEDKIVKIKALDVLMLYRISI